MRLCALTAHASQRIVNKLPKRTERHSLCFLRRCELSLWACVSHPLSDTQYTRTRTKHVKEADCPEGNIVWMTTAAFKLARGVPLSYYHSNVAYKILHALCVYVHRRYLAVSCVRMRLAASNNSYKLAYMARRQLSYRRYIIPFSCLVEVELYSISFTGY